jgi:DNA-directed RNA polymerase subunit RPC12/RpoP
MAEETIFTCLKCGFAVASWSDGNPYIEAPDGARYNFCHPGEDLQIKEIVKNIVGHEPTEKEIEETLDKHAGNEGEFLCRECFEISTLDPDRDPMRCEKCSSKKVVPTFKLGGRVCPKCKKGKFDKGSAEAIS